MKLSGRRIPDDDLIKYYTYNGWKRVFEHNRNNVCIEVWTPSAETCAKDYENTHFHAFRLRDSTKEATELERVYVLRMRDMNAFDACYEVFQKWKSKWGAASPSEKFWGDQQRKCNAKTYN